MGTPSSDPGVASVHIELRHPGWAAEGGTRAIGQAHAGDGKLLRAPDIARCLDAVVDERDWVATVARLNGSFAVVSHRFNRVRAAVDRLRSFPLFYTSANDGIRLSDRATGCLKAPTHGLTLDPDCRLEFEFAGYVTGEETLVAGLRQIRAGHAMLHDADANKNPRQAMYYEYRHRSPYMAPDDELASQLVSVHERAFRRLLEDVGDRQIVIPLSGGYDSRLIGHSLRELGARNVLCYTYGLRNNWESEISRELARHLGFEWVMVPYSAPQWRAVAETDAFRRYFMEAGNVASLAHIQDWPAVQTLVAQGRLGPGAVFVPGHSGDFLAGSHIPRRYGKQKYVSREELLQALFDSHYSLWDWPRDAAGEMRELFAARIERVVGPLNAGTAEQAADAFECWDCQERQAKFIVNSVRAYEFFDLEWRLPLFDAELMDFWSRVPLDGRVARRLYFKFVARFQQLPVAKANTDRGPLLRSAVALMDAAGMRPLAARVRRGTRKLAWRTHYHQSDLGWLAMVDPDEFRKRYTGRENGHAFFARQYLNSLRDS